MWTIWPEFDLVISFCTQQAGIKVQLFLVISSKSDESFGKKDMILTLFSKVSFSFA